MIDWMEVVKWETAKVGNLVVKIKSRRKEIVLVREVALNCLTLC